MAIINFELGDVFQFGNSESNIGLVLQDGALLFHGPGGRLGRNLKKVPEIPEGAQLVNEPRRLHTEIEFAISAVCTALGISKEKKSPLRVISKNELKAAPGKFRAVTQVEHEIYQILEDVDTLHSAESLCATYGDPMGGVQIYDDQGQTRWNP